MDSIYIVILLLISKMESRSYWTETNNDTTGTYLKKGKQTDQSVPPGQPPSGHPQSPSGQSLPEVGGQWSRWSKCLRRGHRMIRRRRCLRSSYSNNSNCTGQQTRVCHHRHHNLPVPPGQPPSGHPQSPSGKSLPEVGAEWSQWSKCFRRGHRMIRRRGCLRGLNSKNSNCTGRRTRVCHHRHHSLIPAVEEKPSPEEHKSNWSYTGELGPRAWGKGFQNCSGKHQSPINLNSRLHSSHAKNNYSNINFLFYNTITNKNTEIEDNGHSVQLSLLEQSTAAMSGGPLKGTYEFQQLHFHWGSEHTVDGKRFPLEMHMVHRLSGIDKRDLLKVSNGLAVTGFLFEISENDNPSLAALINIFAKIRTPGHKTKLKDTLSVPDIISPATTSGYYSYSGSLTTPPCSEVVHWIIFETLLNVSMNQMAAFHTLRDNENGTLDKNFRPVQPLNRRLVKHADYTF